MGQNIDVVKSLHLHLTCLLSDLIPLSITEWSCVESKAISPHGKQG